MLFVSLLLVDGVSMLKERMTWLVVGMTATPTLTPESLNVDDSQKEKDTGTRVAVKDNVVHECTVSASPSERDAELNAECELGKLILY